MVGIDVGTNVGTNVGTTVGATVGVSVGGTEMVGIGVGTNVGVAICAVLDSSDVAELDSSVVRIKTQSVSYTHLTLPTKA